MLLDIVFSVSDDAVFDISKRPKTIMLQLENPILMVKRSRDSRRVDGLDAGQHALIISAREKSVKVLDTEKAPVIAFRLPRHRGKFRHTPNWR